MSSLEKFALTVLLVACGAMGVACNGQDEEQADGEQAAGRAIKVGFAQIGSESDWRVANTASIKAEAKKRGIELVFTDAQQKQENQIKAMRSFIQQKVDVIAFSPIVESGYEPVLREIKAAGIPVILADRGLDVTDDSLYVTFIGSDVVEEGRRAARWFVENTKGDVRVFELRGTPGSSPAIDRSTGFEEVIKDHPRIRIVKSQDGNFDASKGKEVTEALLRTEEGKTINALFAHNDNMAIGAIQAMQEAGLKPGTDIKIVSIDAVRAAFEAMIDGTLNCTVECNPLIGPQLFDIIEAVVAADRLKSHEFVKPALREALGDAFLKRVLVKESVFEQATAKDVIKTRKY